MRDNKIVVIGGGTGTAVVLEALKGYNASAIVSVTDNGRSTAKIREWFKIPAVGDIRNCFSVISKNKELAELLNKRFKNKELEGIAFGNLLMAMLAQEHGFEDAVNKMHKLLDAKARIIPVSLEHTNINAELENGAVVEGEVDIRKLGKAPINRIFLDKDAKAYGKALEEIKKADIIIIGPGSLFVSILSCLVFKDVSEEINRSDAEKIFICNTTTQPGQTDGFGVKDHVEWILKYVNMDYVLVNSGKPSADFVKKLGRDGIKQMFLREEEKAELEKRGIGVVVKDLVENGSERVLWEKQDTVRHDPEKLRKVIITEFLAE